MTDEPTIKSRELPSQPASIPPPPILPEYLVAVPLPELQTEDLPLSVAKRLNWGAALLPLFWLPAMCRWRLFAAYLPIYLFNLFMVLNDSPLVFVTRLTLLGFAIHLLRQGSPLAWQARPWVSVAQFKQVQRVWLWWGIIILIFQLAIFIAGIVYSAWSWRQLQY